jgi:hypothetical protein
VPQLHCALASECRCYAAHHAEIALSKTAAEMLCRLQSSIHHPLPRPAHHSRAPPRRQIAIDGHLPRRTPRVPSLEAFGRRPSAPGDRPRRAGIRNPCVDGPRLARAFLQLGRVWSIAVMCPASVCGRVDRGPRWVTRIGAPNITAGLTPKGFPGVFRSSVRPIAILLLSLQAPGQNEVSRLRPQAAGDRPRRSPSSPRASGPSCWPARLPQASSACAPAN